MGSSGGQAASATPASALTHSGAQEGYRVREGRSNRNRRLGRSRCKKNLATLGGTVVLTQGKNIVHGNKLLIDMNTGEATIKTEPRNRATGRMVSSSDGRRQRPDLQGRTAERGVLSWPAHGNKNKQFNWRRWLAGSIRHLDLRSQTLTQFECDRACLERRRIGVQGTPNSPEIERQRRQIRSNGHVNGERQLPRNPAMRPKKIRMRSAAKAG